MNDPDPETIEEMERISRDLEVKDSGSRQTFETGAQRDTQDGKGDYSLLPFEAIRRLALHYQAGAAKYSAHNWRAGMPVSRYLSSALRHLCQWGDGDRTEDHLAAVMFNVAAIMEVERGVELGFYPPELIDQPRPAAGTPTP